MMHRLQKPVKPTPPPPQPSSSNEKQQSEGEKNDTDSEEEKKNSNNNNNNSSQQVNALWKVTPGGEFATWLQEQGQQQQLHSQQRKMEAHEEKDTVVKKEKETGNASDDDDDNDPITTEEKEKEEAKEGDRYSFATNAAATGNFVANITFDQKLSQQLNGCVLKDIDEAEKWLMRGSVVCGHLLLLRDAM